MAWSIGGIIEGFYGRPWTWDERADVMVGPACRLCPRRDCADRQEEAAVPGGAQAAVRAPLVPREV